MYLVVNSECDPFLALAQRTQIVSVLYLLAGVLGIAVGLVPTAEAPDFAHTLRAVFNSQIFRRFSLRQAT